MKQLIIMIFFGISCCLTQAQALIYEGETIIQYDGENYTVEESRRNGITSTVRVQPNTTLPYYLRDFNGTDKFEGDQADFESTLQTPSWELFQW